MNNKSSILTNLNDKKMKIKNLIDEIESNLNKFNNLDKSKLFLIDYFDNKINKMDLNRE